MVTLSDVPLSLMTAELSESLRRDIPLDRLQHFFGRAWPGPGTVFLANRTDYQPWPRNPARIGDFFWPTGASRYAIAYLLASADQINSIAPGVFGGDGTKSIATELKFTADAPDGTVIESTTWEGAICMPPVPLYRVLNDDGGSNLGSYLLIVVDQRWTWWNIPCPDLGITETAGKTWRNILDTISTALAISPAITTSTISTKYLAPSRALNLTNEPICMVLDSVAASLGMRVVVTYDGLVSLQGFKDGLVDWNTDDAANPQRTTRAGDLRFPDAY